MTFTVTLSRQARRALTKTLSPTVAAACAEFVAGPLAEQPYRVGQPLRPPMEGYFSARRGEFRVIYTVHDRLIRVHVVNIRHRRDAYRT